MIAKLYTHHVVSAGGGRVGKLASWGAADPCQARPAVKSWCGSREKTLASPRPLHCTIFFFFFGLFRAVPTAYKSSQARGQIGAIAANLYHNHSNASSEPCLQSPPQFTAMLDP